MAIAINWGTRVISVPRADLTLVQLVPTEIRELNLNQFHLWLKDLEDSEEGMIFPDTHSHNTEVILGGIVYARVIEIINGYTVTFEDGFYAVNLVGANSNVGDVVNVNSVSVRSSNSAGLIVLGGGFVVKASMSDDDTVSRFVLWAENDLGVITTVTEMSAKIYAHDGFLVTDLGVGTGPSVAGTFLFNCLSSLLSYDVSYFLAVTAVSSGVTKTLNCGFVRVH